MLENLKTAYFILFVFLYIFKDSSLLATRCSTYSIHHNKQEYNEFIYVVDDVVLCPDFVQLLLQQFLLFGQSDFMQVPNVGSILAELEQLTQSF